MSAYAVAQMHQDTVTTLHMVSLQACNQCPDQQPELTSRESTRGILGIDKEWLLVIVGDRAAERERQ